MENIDLAELHYKDVKRKNLLKTSDKYLIKEYCKKYKVNEKTKKNIEIEINTGLNLQEFIKKQKEENLNLEDEANKIEESLRILIASEYLGHNEAIGGEGWIQKIKQSNALINDLINLSKENITVGSLNDILGKYPNLNKKVILSSFNQKLSLKAIPSEIINLFICWLENEIGKNNKQTAFTKNTKELIEKIFDITISKRDIKMYKNTYFYYSLENNI